MSTNYAIVSSIVVLTIPEPACCSVLLHTNQVDIQWFK